MHELSIAVSLVDLAAERIAELDDADPAGTRVEAVHVRLGALAGVAEEALRFSFEAACRGTPLDGARLVVERVPVAVWCTTCGTERAPDDPFRFRCPVCGEPAARVVRGREIELTALEVEAHVPAHR